MYFKSRTLTELKKTCEGLATHVLVTKIKKLKEHNKRNEKCDKNKMNQIKLYFPLLKF